MAKRRGHGEGSITQRSDGRWMARLTLSDGRRQSFYGPTQAAVIEKLDEAKGKIRDAMPLTPVRLTVGQWLERWLRDTVEGSVRPKTAHRYREIVEHHVTPRIGRLRLAGLLPSDVQRMMREARTAGQSPRSVAHHRAVLRAALASAVKEGVIGRNVAALAKPPHVPQREQTPLSPAGARLVLDAVRGDKLEAFYLLLVSSGLREAEALALRWPDVDLEAGTVSVRRVLQRLDGEWSFPEPKTERSRRTIWLAPQSVASLRQHRARQAEERLRAGPLWEGDRWGGLLFTSEVGGPLHPTTALKRFQKLLTRAGLPAMRLHDLRHGAASLMAALGVPPRVAMEVLGHSQIATTMNIYAHVPPEYAREASGQVAIALWGA